MYLSFDMNIINTNQLSCTCYWKWYSWQLGNLTCNHQVSLIKEYCAVLWRYVLVIIWTGRRFEISKCCWFPSPLASASAGHDTRSSDSTSAPNICKYIAPASIQCSNVPMYQCTNIYKYTAPASIQCTMYQIHRTSSIQCANVPIFTNTSYQLPYNAAPASTIGKLWWICIVLLLALVIVYESSVNVNPPSHYWIVFPTSKYCQVPTDSLIHLLSSPMPSVRNWRTMTTRVNRKHSLLTVSY